MIYDATAKYLDSKNKYHNLLSKKVRLVRVSVKAGYRVLLRNTESTSNQ